ncbi:MotA/TolQ/ExbB proton channel family protein [uncultured Microbulbifer sp.]|uniref:MotA/TolQ/ExbB proton channel family protein n=1 Tax=uncultured Microbulbifer sp. TaxID=348147 RepID=UPI0026227AFC|nr:MotA/TolQ/ExbB proton channel family protein [uncultured Microbulbifer sp.]
MIATIENLMANVADVLMTPVLLIILVLFAYALYAVGRFVALWALRRRNAVTYRLALKQGRAEWLPGYQVHNYFVRHPAACEDELEVFALKKLETLRMATRLAPMLGLIATMIPMGPALRALADGNIQGISDNLIIAFAAVIWGLVIATLTFWPASVKKRWFAAELINIRKLKEPA